MSLCFAHMHICQPLPEEHSKDIFFKKFALESGGESGIKGNFLSQIEMLTSEPRVKVRKGN